MTRTRKVLYTNWSGAFSYQQSTAPDSMSEIGSVARSGLRFLRAGCTRFGPAVVVGRVSLSEPTSSSEE